MSKYIDADLLAWKIKRQIRLENLNFAALGGGEQTFCTNTLEWVLKQIDSLQQEQPEVELEKASRNVYESWQGGTMDDFLRDMVELGKALNTRKEE